MFDVEKIRKDFPILSRLVHGKKLVYFDNAATTQKPKQVIETIQNYYSNLNSNIHRGVHYLSEAATKEYECARKIIQNFINAKHLEEIIYTRGTTESINLVASSYGYSNFKEGDEILISAMEHHSNIVPWQIICQRTGAKLKVIPMNDNGEIIIEEFDKLLNEKTKFVSIVHVSNSLGTINPIKYIIDKAHRLDIPVLVDAAQSIQHLKIDVQDLDCDFLAFSGHKIYGPTGIGILYGKKKHLIEMPPYQGGGDMIMSVSFEKTIYNELPYKFEAGTPNIAGVIGLGVAIRYVNNIGIEVIEKYEKELLDYGSSLLSDMPELKIIGNAANKASVISFIIDNAHPHDVGTILDREGIAIRTGHHCTEPVMRRFNIPATSRASFSFYNTFEEIDVLAKSLKKVINLFN
ncbi:MAG: cysteine desulfurase [Candidatus Kapabacteria bacterium]|nr:cysteine desulfurase [Candidatus Kapabacteria bacterium]